MSGFGGSPPGLGFGFNGAPVGATDPAAGFGFNSTVAGASQAFGSPANFGGLQASSGLARPPGLPFGTPAPAASSPAQGFGLRQGPSFGGSQGSGGGFQGFGSQLAPGTSATLFGSSPSERASPAPSSGFGQASGISTGFGVQAGLGSSSAVSGFKEPSVGFGQQQPAATGFGQQQAGAHIFGQQQPSSSFGNQPTVSGFGQPQRTSGFGQPQSTSVFGQQATSPRVNLAPVQTASTFRGDSSAGLAPKMQFGQHAATAGAMAQPSSQLEAAPKKTFDSWTSTSQALKPSQRVAKPTAPPAENTKEANMSMEEMRRRALASTPAFVGGGGGGGGDASSSYGNGAGPSNASAPSAPRKQLAGRLQGGSMARGSPQDQQALERRSARFRAPTMPQQPPLPPEEGHTGGGESLRGGSTADGAAGAGAGGGEGRGNGDPVVGTCTLMCPVQERNARESSGNIRFFERPDPAVNLSSPELAVKTFARTGIDELGASDFRTRAALEKTMEHLRGIMDQPANKARIHNFLFDRYRSVRQDLYVQGLQDEMAMSMYEETVRYHVLCEHELCTENAGAGDADGFSSPLNREQCNKALISLQEMYESAVRRGCPRPAAIEAEFRAYHMLMLLNEHGRLKSAKLQIVSSLQEMRPEVLAEYHIQQAIALHNALDCGNYAGFFQIVRRLPYLMACLSHRFFPAMWEHALETLAEIFRNQQWYPLAQLENLLLLDSPAFARSLCEEYDLHVGIIPGSGELGVFFDPSQAFSRLAGGALVQLQLSAVVALKGVVPTSGNVIRQIGNAADEESRVAAAAQLEDLRAEDAAQQIQLMHAAAAVAAQEGQLMQEQQQNAAAAATAQQEAAQHAQHAAAQQAAAEHAAEAERQLLVEEEMRLAQAAAHQQAQRDEAQRRAAAAAVAVAEAAASRRQQERQQMEDQRRREDEQRRQEAALVERRRAAEQRATQAAHARQLAEQERIRQAESAQRERAEEGRLAVQLRGRFLVRLWRLSARRQRTERALISMAACSTAGSLRRSPATKQSPGMLSTAMVLKRPLLDSAVTEPLQKRKRPAAQQWRRADVVSAMAPGLAARSPGAPELFSKILLLQSGADNSEEPLLMHWLRAKMAAPLGASTTATVSRDDVVAAYAEDLQLRNAKASSMRICVREVHSTAPEQAAQGATGIVFLVSKATHPADMAAHVRAATLAAPQGVMLPLLLVTANAGECIRQQLQHAAEEAVGDDLESPFREVAVISLAAASALEKGPFSQKALMGGLQWLSQRAPREPRVEVRSLQSLLEGELQQQLLPVRMDWAAIPADYLAAYSVALVTVSQRIRMSASSVVGRWGWPAPELSSKADEEPAPSAALWIPSGWAEPQHCGLLMSAVQNLALPPPLEHLMTAQDVAEYLHSIGTGDISGGDWRGMLEAAFSARFAALAHSSLLPPAVLLPDEQLNPPLQPAAVQSKQAALLVSALRLQPAAPSFLVASKRHISAAFSGLTSGWLRPRQADLFPTPSRTYQAMVNEPTTEQTLVAAEPGLAARPEGLLAGRLACPAPSGGLMELMAIFEEEQASLCALDRRLMVSLTGGLPATPS